MVNDILIYRHGDQDPELENNGKYEYEQQLIVPKAGNPCTVAIMEIPPGKANYPYHFHADIMEVFYIIAGEGRLEMPDGEKSVTAGDVIVFPPSERGAHKIINTSENEILRYLDVDTTSPADICFYPNSNKVGVNLNGKAHGFFRESDKVDYYDGE
jgi:uncharacterized cupin superfamily protein